MPVVSRFANREQLFIIYGSQEEMILGLASGDVDASFIPGVVAPPFRVLLDRPEIEVVENEMNGFYYLGFNLRKPPMSDPAFRRALAVMIDRDSLTADVFNDGLKPAWTLLPSGNLDFLDPRIASEIASKYTDMDRFERLEKAVGILEEAGYSWEKEPAVVTDDWGRTVIEPGRGVRMPNGGTVDAIEVLALGGDFLIWFPSYAIYVEGLLRDLGFPARSNLTGFGGLVSRVWPGVGQEPPFDLYLLGWLLGNPARPTFHEAFFHSSNLAELTDGDNSVGYVNSEFDQLTADLNQAATREEAKAILWEMERILDRDLPIVVLGRLRVIDGYWKTRVKYPFTTSLGGIGDDPRLVRFIGE